MATNHIAIACQGGGSHAAYTGGVLPVLLEEFDNLPPARADEEAGPERTALVAISGTSGGAISALLGWYGFITGGAPEASRRLDAFWQGNSALGVVEASVNRFCRGLADLASLGGWDIKSSPYVLPLAGMAWWNATVWPAIARMLGPDNAWMRPDFFSLPALLQPGVDWPLVAMLGEFASLPVEVERWLRSDLEAAMFPAGAPCQDRYRAERGAVEKRIAEKLGAADRLRGRMAELGIGEGTLLHAAMTGWHPPAVRSEAERFNADALGQLADSVRHALRPIPRLLLGAVELHEGEFVAFSSERAPGDGGISIDSVLASAAVPWLFRAHDMRGTDDLTLAHRPLTLWDGLFSQNPPIRNFLSGVTDDARKPDEIWVVQINPTQAKAEAGRPHALPRIAFSGSDIWDLRNALAGNLALNQELGFVDAINRRMETGRGEDEAPASTAAQRRDKLVQVDRIVMDEAAVEAAAGMPLGANSKLDRDPALRSALWAHGTVQARRYLALRRRVDKLFAGLDGALAGACACAGGLPPDGDGGFRPDGAARLGELVVDGATLHAISPDDPGAPQALVQWRSAHTRISGRPVRIEGRTELATGDGAEADWHLKDVRITAIVPTFPAEPAPTPARVKARRQAGQSTQVRPQSEARH